MAALSQTRGSSTIPAYGPFIVYPGHSARGVVNGHLVENFPSGANRNSPRIEIDGNEVKFAASGASDVPDVSRTGVAEGFAFDGPICQKKAQNCGKQIQLMTQNGDLSDTFWVTVRTGVNVYAERPG